MAIEFRKEKEDRFIDKINEICDIMPNFVKRFVISMQQTTEVETRYAYVNDVKNFIEYLSEGLGINPKDITLEQIEGCTKDFFEDYLNYLQKYEKEGKKYTNGRASMKRKMSSLRSFYSYLFKSDLIKICEIEKVDMPVLKRKELVYMDYEEANNFIDIVNNGKVTGTNMEKKYHDLLGYRNYVIVLLLLTTGIRVSELVGLDIDDINLKKDCFKVIRKGNKEDYVYYPKEIGELLKDYLDYRSTLIPLQKNFNALFLSTRGTRLSIRSVEALIKKYGQKTNPSKKIHCHTTRSSFAMEFLKNSNGDVEGLQSALGHNNISTTQFYARSTQEMKEKRKEMVTFNKKSDIEINE